MKVLPLSLSGFLAFVALLLGIFVSSFLALSVYFLWGILVSGGIFIATGIKKRNLLVIGVIAIAFFFGALRMSTVQNSQKYLISGAHMIFSGQIVESPELRGASLQFVVKAESLEGTPRLLVIAQRFPQFLRGETLVISGKVEPLPEDNENYRDSLKRRGISGTVPFPKITLAEPQPFSWLRTLDELKVRFEMGLRDVLPEPDAGFVIGILLGERSSISDELRDAFARTSTSHIVALSGFNITIIAIAVSWVLGVFHPSVKARFFGSTIFIALFVLLVGGGSSVIRAALMGLLALLALERGRIYDMTNALVFAAAVMALINPYLLRFDLSFQLSFLATLGIILVPPLLEKYLLWLPERFDIRKIVSATLSAEIFVFPLILWNFGAVSVIGPIANLLVLPLIPEAMLLGFASGITAMVWPALALFTSWPLHVLVSYQLGVVQILSRFSLASVSLPQFASIAIALPAVFISFRYLKRRFRPFVKVRHV